MIDYITAKDDSEIVMDFFSGSATTAHAVMQLNAEDGGNRRFILVQLPALCDEKSEAAKAGFENICEIGKERIRRVGRKLLEEVSSGIGRLDGVGYGMGIDNLEEYRKATGDMVLDTGFRVFKLDSSNLQTWDATPVDELRMEDLLNRMNTMINRVKADRSDLDMVYEVMLKLVIKLNWTA